MRGQHLETYSEDEKRRIDRMRKWAQMYRNVFDSADGRYVLLDILNDLHHYDAEEVSQEVMYLQRAAKRMLAKMMVLHPDNLMEITNSYLAVPMPAKGEYNK